MTKKKHHNQSSDKADPHAEREARKYENPIASRELMLDVMSKSGEPHDLAAISRDA